MTMPTPNDHHRHLARLAGTWRGTETMHPSHWDPQGGTADGVTVCRVALDGFAVVSDYRQQRGGQTTFEGHGVYTIDAHNHEVVLHWFDSTGQACETFRGNWHGDVLQLTSKSPMGFARLTWDFSQPGKLKSAMDTSPDGAAWARLFDGVYDHAQ